MQKFRKWETVVCCPWRGTVGLAMSGGVYLPVSMVGISILQPQTRQEGLGIGYHSLKKAEAACDQFAAVSDEE